MREPPRLWVHIVLNMQARGFDPVPRLIGRAGCNTRRISEATGAKVRIRGRGSGFLEVKGAEAPVPLMMAVTADGRNVAGFVRAVEMALEVLSQTGDDFASHCQQHGLARRAAPFCVRRPPPGAARDALRGVLSGPPARKSRPAEGQR